MYNSLLFAFRFNKLEMKLVIDLQSTLFNVFKLAIKEQNKEWYSEIRRTENALINPLVKTVDYINRVINIVFRSIRWWISIEEIDEIIIVDRGSGDRPHWHYIDKYTHKYSYDEFAFRQLRNAAYRLERYIHVLEPVIRKQVNFQFELHEMEHRKNKFRFVQDELFYRDLHKFNFYLTTFQINYTTSVYKLVYEYLYNSLIRFNFKRLTVCSGIRNLDSCIVIGNDEFFLNSKLTNSKIIDIQKSLIMHESRGRAHPNPIIEPPLKRNPKLSNILDVCTQTYGPILDINDDSVIMYLYGSTLLKNQLFVPDKIEESEPISYFPKLVEKMIENLERNGVNDLESFMIANGD